MRKQTVDPGHVLIVSHDVVGTQMAGPGIRYYHLARVLAREFPIVLAVPSASTAHISADFSVLSYQSVEDPVFRAALRGARALLVPALWLSRIPASWRTAVPLVIDGYDPFLAEALAIDQGDTSMLQSYLAEAYLEGDFFICASERQRDWWLGLLEAYGRINPWTFQDDPSLRRLVDVVPFGLPETYPLHSRQVIKGVWPGIGRADRVILWAGGLWPWLDAATAIRAIARTRRHRRDVRLVFPGVRHPNPEMTSMPTQYQAALQTAQELGLLGEVVFFGSWVPYADWPSVLLESDIALTLHYNTLETRLAFRSRVLDCIWARLPLVATKGDATSQLVTQYQLGKVVEYEDAGGVAEAISVLLETPREAFRGDFEQARQALTWERAAQPLLEFCRQPRQAPDKGVLGRKLGSPFYLSRIEYLESLVKGYERGRFIRLMRWLHRAKKDPFLHFFRKTPTVVTKDIDAYKQESQSRD